MRKKLNAYFLKKTKGSNKRCDALDSIIISINGKKS
jgi:hypothetical protein